MSVEKYRDIDKAYVSPYDEFLFRFDHDHAKSASQQKEINKHRRIAELRDNQTSDVDNTVIWEGF
jgi:hypothetical protein